MFELGRNRDFYGTRIFDPDADIKEKVFNRENVERSKLRVDTRKWLMSRRLPKRYGDKVDVAHAGDISITKRMEEARKRLQDDEAKRRAT